LLSFEEPWFYQRRLAVGFSLYRNEASYISQFYNELRYGGEIYMRKRIFELVQGKLYYGYQIADINGISEAADPKIKAMAGTYEISKIGFGMERDTRDNYAMPTRGSRLALINEVAGLGGNVSYYRLEAQAAKWWPTFDAFKQVASLAGRAGTLVPLDSKGIPIFEQYELGGPNNLRGYKFNKVSPLDVYGNNIGGLSMAWFSAEYSAQVLDIIPLRLAVFYDGGFVNVNDFSFSPSPYWSDAGFGVRVMVMGSPLRIDLAWPIYVPPGGSPGMNFNLSFGVVF
jgi:outer membrane protein insertion porin family